MCTVGLNCFKKSVPTPHMHRKLAYFTESAKHAASTTTKTNTVLAASLVGGFETVFFRSTARRRFSATDRCAVKPETKLLFKVAIQICA